MNGLSRSVRLTLLLCATLAGLSACRRGFRAEDFANPEALFRGALQQFEAGKMGDAILGFERLSIELSSRDSLLVPTYYYLARAHERRSEFLLASQAYARLSDGFPSDSLAPIALLGEGRSYQRMWRKWVLDPEYGLKALGTFRVLLTAYPDGPEARDAETRIATVEDWLARKDYETGVHYLKTRKAYDPAIIYFQDVVETYPSTPTARKAWLGILSAYRSLKYEEEQRETCDEMVRRYAGDREVLDECRGLMPAAPDSLSPVAWGGGSPLRPALRSAGQATP